MKHILSLLAILLAFNLSVFSQATVSYPYAIGRNSNCGGGTGEVHFYHYDEVNNIIDDITDNTPSNLVARYRPQLRIGNAGGGSQRFSEIYASISYNPKDHNIYYVWTSYNSGNEIPGQPRPWTYVWRWPLGSKPTSTSPRLDTLCSFNADLLGIVFDDDGNAYTLDFSYDPANTPQQVFIRSVDFSTSTLGAPDFLNFTGGAVVYNYGSGDIAMTPSGQMIFALDNKLFTLDYQSYTGTGANLTSTYIDTVITPGGNFVGLTYAQGETVAAYSGGGCPFNEIDPLTAVATNITKQGGSAYSAWDMASVVSGIGAAKKLVSYTPTGTPGQYDLVYDVYIRNYGNMDVTNVQVTDDLRDIHGAANVSNVSAVFIDNPAGLVLNPGFNGETDINLLNGTGTLPNFPVANNHATIRITCRVSNIQTGVVYYNSAIITATDFNSNNLTDSSTNGSNPDLNSNDKPDDLGEAQPTPFLISVTAYTPPCATLSQVLYHQNFGSGGGLVTTIPAAAIGGTVGTTTYTGTTTAPAPVENYTISNNAQNGDNSKWINLTDHTGSNGRMLLVNADAQANVLYSDVVSSLCPNQQYSLYFYAAFIGNSSYQTICDGFGGFKYPDLTLRVRDLGTGLVIAQLPTGIITNTSWQQYGMKFVLPSGFSNIIIDLVNNGEGGCGNDIAIDDIQFGLCDAVPIVNVNATTAGCLGGATTFTSTLTDGGVIPGAKDYQWQISTTASGPWTDISGATSANYVISSVGPGDVGKYYRVLIAAQGNMSNSGCVYTSAGVLLTAKDPSVAPTAATANTTNICPGYTVTLSVVGGTLGDNAQWHWYSGSCGGTAIGTGSAINVSPASTTTYYVRAEGDCNTTACQSVTININCDIDKDDDGIPDYVESYIPTALQDANSNGVNNAFDNTYLGFVDNNGDFINDNFQADGDSDGDGTQNCQDTDFAGRIDANSDGIDDRFDTDLDGIINMLDLDSDNDGITDVAEARGVDANGDGLIDNFSDSDVDGLSDQVDGSLSGAYNSGAGLGAYDTDSDWVPNAIDLDSDADGIPDVREVNAADANNDGRIDGFTDSNSDGIDDNILLANALLRTGADTNSDGRANSYPYQNMDEDFPPNPYDIDSDGDGIVDVLEANLSDANLDGKADGAIGTDGWSTTVSSMGALSLPNADSDANLNYQDIDSDNDGIPDNIEGPSTLDYDLPTGLDNDNDGLDNAYDNQINVFGGHGSFILDKDGDGTDDYLDLDTDGDMQPDIKEGHDYNFNGYFDETTTLLGTDADGDGLDDRFDLDNTSTKGTSSNMGNGGSTSGDPSPGTRAVVQKTLPASGDRDWRWSPYVLPIQLVDFDAVAQGDRVQLTWSVIANERVKEFEILSSTDNIHFTKVAGHEGIDASNKKQQFVAIDDYGYVNVSHLFYRLIVRGSTKDVYSKVVKVKINGRRSTLKLIPNPTRHSTLLQINSEKEGQGILRVLDKTGRVILKESHEIFVGQNRILINNLSRFAEGVYTVQLISDGEINSIKLIIIK